MKKKKQTSDLSSELQKCGYCGRNVVDLSKHLESKVCRGINKTENLSWLQKAIFEASTTSE